MAIIAWLGSVVLRREAVGFGDITLMATIGAVVGPPWALVVIPGGAVFTLCWVVVQRAWGHLRFSVPSSEGARLRARSGTSDAAELDPEAIPFAPGLVSAAILLAVWWRLIGAG
jgi:prepilin signal peptidase PulO-like enzyme (type II secretory pathway)